MKYTKTWEESLFSTLRIAEGVCWEVQNNGKELSEALAIESNFRIYSTMTAIEMLLEYGWERAASSALANGAKAEDILTPDSLAEYIGQAMTDNFIDSVNFLQKEENISDEEVVSFLEHYYKEGDDAAGESCWGLQNLYLEFRNK